MTYIKVRVHVTVSTGWGVLATAAAAHVELKRYVLNVYLIV